MAASAEGERRRYIAEDLDASGHFFAGGGLEDAFGVEDRAGRVKVFAISYSGTQVMLMERGGEKEGYPCWT